MGSQSDYAIGGLSGKINRQSMQKELEALEVEYSVGWREFEIGELFTKRTMKGYPKNAENLARNENGYHVFGQNIKYQYPQRIVIDEKYLHQVNENKPILAYTSSVGEVGMIAESFYRSGDNGAFQGLFFKEENYNKKHILYLLSTLQKQFSQFGYATSMSEILSLKIKLPVKSDGEIAFAYIEKFVETLEAERLATLEAYLQATGLKDTEFSSAEAVALSALDMVEWKEFEIDKLFNVYPSKSYSALNDDKILDKNGKTPYVSNQSQNNGYIGWSNLEPLNNENVITLSDTWQSERTIFYQPKAFIGKSHLQVMSPYSDKFDKYTAWFIISSFRKSILGMNYDYGTKFNREKIKTTKIQLPVSTDGKIDYEFMSNLTKAMQKIVIKGVVEWTDKKIQTKKRVVESG